MNNNIDKEKIVSPCISICRTDPRTGYCYGCARNEKEKKIWKDPTTSNEWKKENIIEIQKRMEGWQLESFLESYNYKTMTHVVGSETQK